MDKTKVTAYIPEELNTRMWIHINQTSAGTSTYGAVSNFVTNAVIAYLSEPYYLDFVSDDSQSEEVKDEDV